MMPKLKLALRSTWPKRKGLDFGARRQSATTIAHSRLSFSMKSITLHAELIIAFVLLISSSAAAQQPTPQPTPRPRDESITGRVVNEAGQPIPGVSISLDVLGGYMGHRASTDSDGNFKIPGLDGGVYRLYLL